MNQRRYGSVYFTIREHGNRTVGNGLIKKVQPMGFQPLGCDKQTAWLAKLGGHSDRTNFYISTVARKIELLGKDANCEFRLHRTYPMADLGT